MRALILVAGKMRSALASSSSIHRMSRVARPAVKTNAHVVSAGLDRFLGAIMTWPAKGLDCPGEKFRTIAAMRIDVIANCRRSYSPFGHTHPA